MENERPKDEDLMIEKLQLHRDTVDFVCAVLSEKGVQYERTSRNNPRGDILLVRQNDIDKAKSILEDLNVEI